MPATSKSDTPVESRAGALTVGNRWLVRRFRFGPQSSSHGHGSSPRSPNPACGFPALGSPVGSCISHTEHQGDNGQEVIGFFISDVGCGGGTAPALRSPSLPAGRPACSRLDNPVIFERGLHPSSGSVPSLGHVMLPGFPAVVRGCRHRHSRDPRPFGHRSSPEAPSLRRHYSASSVVRASPPPRTARPFPRGLSVGACHATAGGFPCCNHPPLPCVLPPLPRRNRSVHTSLASRPMAAFPVIQAGRPLHYPF